MKKLLNMLIGEVSRITGFSRDAIRFYEKKRLIEVGRTASEWNNYKNYDEEALRKLLLIKKCKGFGFTLNEIREILILFDANEATCEAMSDRVREKLSDIEHKIEELQQVKKMILDKFDASGGNCIDNAAASNCGELAVVNQGAGSADAN